MDLEMKIKQELYDKLQEEYDNFIENLKTMTPEQIIDNSYEKVMKEELKDMFFPSMCNYDLAQIKALKKAEAPLDELYQGWMDFDGGIHESLEYSVEDTLDFLQKEQKKNKNKSMER